MLYRIFLENNIAWFLNSLDFQSTDSLEELYNIISYSEQLSAPVFERECIIQKKL